MRRDKVRSTLAMLKRDLQDVIDSLDLNYEYSPRWEFGFKAFSASPAGWDLGLEFGV